MKASSDLLKQLISSSGLSGREGPVNELIQEAWQPLVDDIHVSRVGSIQALSRGNAPEPRPVVMLATHMDAIGLMVTAVAGEFLRITAIGGIDHRVLPGQLVTVHGREDLPGVVAQPPGDFIPAGGSDPVEMKYLLVDVGLEEDLLREKVRVGDLVSFAQPPMEMGKDVLAGHSLDNRASVVALTRVFEGLKKRSHAWDVWGVATVQEEETMLGAKTSAFDLQPDLAVAVDVTFARGPGTADYQAYPLGEGITLGWGPTVHPALFESMKETAETFEIPYKTEPLPRRSGTDADALQLTASGIPTMVISIPLRYMHTPVEIVSLKDIHRAGRLLSEWIAQLPLDFMDTFRWEL